MFHLASKIQSFLDITKAELYLYGNKVEAYAYLLYRGFWLGVFFTYPLSKSFPLLKSYHLRVLTLILVASVYY